MTHPVSDPKDPLLKLLKLQTPASRIKPPMLVGGLNPCEKYEFVIWGLGMMKFPIYGNIKSYPYQLNIHHHPIAYYSPGIISPNKPSFYVIMAVCQNLVPLVNIKISWDLWMFIPLKMVLIGIDPYPVVKVTDSHSHPMFTIAIGIYRY